MTNTLLTCLVIAFNGILLHCLGQQNNQRPLEINFQKPQTGQVTIIYGMDLSCYGSRPFRPDSYKLLDSIAIIIDGMTNCIFQIEFHTDCRADSAYNNAISQRQADSAVAYIERKIKSNRIIALGAGERQLLNNCFCEGKEMIICTEEEHQINRRMQIRLVQILDN